MVLLRWAGALVTFGLLMACGTYAVNEMEKDPEVELVAYTAPQPAGVRPAVGPDGWETYSADAAGFTLRDGRLGDAARAKLVPLTGPGAPIPAEATPHPTSTVPGYVHTVPFDWTMRFEQVQVGAGTGWVTQTGNGWRVQIPVGTDRLLEVTTPHYFTREQAIEFAAGVRLN